MSKATVTLSDFTSAVVPEEKQVRMVIEHHPVLGDEQVELDANLAEVEPLFESTGQYIVAKFHLPDGTIKSAVVEVQTFDAAFQGDPYAVLKDARRVKATRAGNGAAKGELELIRTWARENGHDVKDKGRIAAPIVEAYKLANPQAA
jgi:hypothetical protein